jgi:hypothetical protein
MNVQSWFNICINCNSKYKMFISVEDIFHLLWFFFKVLNSFELKNEKKKKKKKKNNINT